RAAGASRPRSSSASAATPSRARSRSWGSTISVCESCAPQAAGVPLAARGSVADNGAPGGAPGSAGTQLMRLHVLCLVGLSMLAPVARAADAISTDRPEVVESSDVVGRGRVQIETGVQSERDVDGGTTTRTRTTPT